jgi:Polysaccharide pyruvyl transferase
MTHGDTGFGWAAGIACEGRSAASTRGSVEEVLLINYSDTANLGDEIQRLAVKQFLPLVDCHVDREQLHQVSAEAGEQCWMVMNGWYCHKPENWPPSPALRPLPISLHISPDSGGAGGVGLRARDILLSPPFRKYLAGFGPVGARDLTTLQLLQAAGIDSYFSGCITLTLQRPDVPRDDGLIVANDLPGPVHEAVWRTADKRVTTTAHWNEQTTRTEERFALAQNLLMTYAQASCVVTTRLHCALPCVAMGTPVLLLDAASDQHRFDGLHDFVRHCNVEDFLQGRAGFDINNPPPNPDKHVPYANALSKRVMQFVEAPELPLAVYPLSPADIQDGLRLINRKTAEILFGEKGARIALQKRIM